MARLKKGDRVRVRGSGRGGAKPLDGTIAHGKNGWWVVKLDDKATARCMAGLEPYRGRELMSLEEPVKVRVFDKDFDQTKWYAVAVRTDQGGEGLTLETPEGCKSRYYMHSQAFDDKQAARDYCRHLPEIREPVVLTVERVATDQDHDRPCSVCGKPVLYGQPYCGDGTLFSHKDCGVKR